MKGVQVFPSWVSTVKAKLGDGVDNTAANVRGRSDTQIEQQQGANAEFSNAGDSSYMKAPRTVYKGHQMPVRCVAVMVVPDSEDTLVFSGGEDKLVFVWSLKTGEKVAELYGHTQRVTSLCTYSGPGVDPLVISASWDERLRIWPVKSCIGHTSIDSTLSEKVSSESIILKGHTSRVFGVTVVNRAGEPPFVASGSSDNTIRVWSLPDGKPMYVLEDEEDVTWNLCMSSFYIPPREGSALNGTVIISGCKNSTVRVWNHRTDWASEAAMTHPQSSSRVQGVIDLITGKPAPARMMPDMVIANHPSAVHSLVPFEYQDEALVATVCKDLDIRIFSLVTGSLIKVLRGHKNFISDLAVCDVSNARGGAILVSASRDGANMRVWKYSTGECLRFLKGHTMDINAVGLFPSPNTRSDDLVVVSASRDTTVRTWLFAEEKALKVFDHGSKIKIKAMDVYQAEGNSIIVTGADDGALRAWRTKRNEGEEEHSALEWKIEKAHKHQVISLCVYAPLADESGYFATQVNKHWPAYLSAPLVFSTSRNGSIRVASLKDGKEVVPPFQAHHKVVTSMVTCSGARSTIHTRAMDPFLVTGSEDNTAILWSMVDFTQLRVLEGHIFDVTSVAVYLPSPVLPQWDAVKKTRTSNPSTPRERADSGSNAGAGPQDLQPLIITGSMDQNVIVWEFATGAVVKTLSNADSHITSVAALNIQQGFHTKHVGPVVIAGDGYGNIWVWSLDLPYSLLYTLQSHTDEVRSIFAYDAEGLQPVLVSGSLDGTVKAWNLDSMKLTKTVEGHTADVTQVRVVNLGGSDLALVSASLDTTTRVVYDFMEAAPQQDLVMQLFNFDINGINVHVTSDSASAFPRIAHLSRKEGAEEFFGAYYNLFGEAIRRGRADFVEEFLPLSTSGLLRSNRSEGSSTKPGAESEGGSLLRMALDRSDLKGIRAIVACWCTYFSDAPADYIHDSVDGRLSMPDMLMLAETAPAEFEKLICSIKAVPVPDNAPPAGSHFLYVRESDKTYLMDRLPAQTTTVVTKISSAASDAGGSTAISTLNERRYLYLPMTNAAHMDMLRAYASTCEELDSVEIFNSEVGQLALSYAWRRMGLRAHVLKFGLYLVYIILATTSLLTFMHNKGRAGTGWISYALIIAQLVLDGYFIKEEGLQLGVNPVEYLSDIWNAMDFVVVVTNVVANILRLAYDRDIVATRVLLCICSIVGYFNILYYLRAFEATGPLVSMILKITQDMMYLIVVVMIVLVGFSQAFWILSMEHGDLPFGTIEASLLNSFVFMLGGFDPSAFEGIYLARFAVALSCLYMLIVSILLLNLLIALMGDSYGSVKEKGLAQWKLEQAQIITEMQGSMSEADRNCTALVYLRTNHAEPESAPEDTTAKLEGTIAELKQTQKVMMKMLAEQQSRMQQQMELNAVLKEFLSKSM